MLPNNVATWNGYHSIAVHSMESRLEILKIISRVYDEHEENSEEEYQWGIEVLEDGEYFTVKYSQEYEFHGWRGWTYVYTTRPTHSVFNKQGDYCTVYNIIDLSTPQHTVLWSDGICYTIFPENGKWRVRTDNNGKTRFSNSFEDFTSAVKSIK